MSLHNWNHFTLRHSIFLMVGDLILSNQSHLFNLLRLNAEAKIRVYLCSKGQGWEQGCFCNGWPSGRAQAARAAPVGLSGVTWPGAINTPAACFPTAALPAALRAMIPASTVLPLSDLASPKLTCGTPVLSTSSGWAWSQECKALAFFRDPLLLNPSLRA